MRRVHRSATVVLLSFVSVAPITMTAVPRAAAQVDLRAPVRPERIEEPPAPRGGLHIHGTAVALDRDGGVHEHENGSLVLFADDVTMIAIRSGTWEAWIDPHRPVEIGDVELAGRAIAVRMRPLAPPFDAAIELRSSWIDDLVVHVVDAKSGAELDDVDIVRHDWHGSDGPHPGIVTPVSIIATKLCSPIRLTRCGNFHVRAAGHAWLDFPFHSERTQDELLRLAPACSLEIDARKIDPKTGAKLRIESIDPSRELLTLPAPADGKGHVELDSLPPGRIVVIAELDFDGRPWVGHRIPLGRADAELAPGAPARVAFDVGRPPAGLHEDGTVDRAGVIAKAGAARAAPIDVEGSIEFGFVKVDPVDSEGRHRSWSYFQRKGSEAADLEEQFSSPIVHGAFAVLPPYGAHLEVTSLVLAGKEISFRNREPFFDSTPDPIVIALDPGQAAEITATPTLLHVQSARTGAELSHVEIVSGIAWPQCDQRHPGDFEPGQVLVRDGVSPLPMPTRRAERGRGTTFMANMDQTFWVRADGHAWQRFRQKPTAGGERTVSLEPACDLDVRLDPSVFAAGAVLRVRAEMTAQDFVGRERNVLAQLGYDAEPDDDAATSRPTESPQREAPQEDAAPFDVETTSAGQPVVDIAPAADGTTAICGLPARRLVVRLELGDWFRRPKAFGAVVVDGRKGGRIAVTLNVEPPPAAPARVELSGTLFVPPEWGEIKATLYAKPESLPNSDFEDWIQMPVARMRRNESTPGLLEWSAGKVLPGEFELSLGEFGFERRITVGLEGDRGQRIEIAPPADVVVHVVDADTRAPVAIRSISWFADDSSNSRATVAKEYDGKTSTFAFRAPIGKLRVSVWEPLFAASEEELDIGAGRNEATIALVRECGIRLVLHQGSAVIPWDEEAFRATLVRVDGKGRARGGGGDEHAFCITVEEPGRYRVAFGSFPGYKLVTPIEVYIARGKFVDVDVELFPDR